MRDSEQNCFEGKDRAFMIFHGNIFSSSKAMLKGSSNQQHIDRKGSHSLKKTQIRPEYIVFIILDSFRGNNAV